jgi:hypothetical protein
MIRGNNKAVLRGKWERPAQGYEMFRTSPAYPALSLTVKKPQSENAYLKNEVAARANPLPPGQAGSTGLTGRAIMLSDAVNPQPMVRRAAADGAGCRDRASV